MIEPSWRETGLFQLEFSYSHCLTLGFGDGVGVRLIGKSWTQITFLWDDGDFRNKYILSLPLPKRIVAATTWGLSFFDASCFPLHGHRRSKLRMSYIILNLDWDHLGKLPSETGFLTTIMNGHWCRWLSHHLFKVVTEKGSLMPVQGPIYYADAGAC